jgi:hypothetical protein
MVKVVTDTIGEIRGQIQTAVGEYMGALSVALTAEWTCRPI